MLYQSRWAPSQTKKRSVSRKTDYHRNDPPQASSSSSVSAAQPDNFSGWSDPALRMIDEESNRMDIDFEVPTAANGPGSSAHASLVIDTNVLISYLDVLQQFTDDVDRVGEPISIVIPGVVVQELDYQKNDRSRDLCWPARMASTWILSKLKEHRNVRGQAYQETLQRSGSYKTRDPGTSNDDLIVDCCLFLSQKKNHNVLAVSQDKLFSASAEIQGIHTLNPRDFTRWSSRALALYIFGDGYPRLTEFADYKETFRPKRVREAIDHEMGVQTLKRVTVDDDGMEIDEDIFTSNDPPPQHLLDDLHIQVLEHFGILLSELLRRVAPSSLFTQARSSSGASSSMYASPTSSKPAKEWKANEILVYLCEARRLPRSAAAEDFKYLTSQSTRMVNFFTQKYDTRGRSGQHWSRADWVSCLEMLGVLARVYQDDAIANSLVQVAPQIDLVFMTPMRPTGTGSFYE